MSEDTDVEAVRAKLEKALSERDQLQHEKDQAEATMHDMDKQIEEQNQKQLELEDKVKKAEERATAIQNDKAEIERRRSELENDVNEAHTEIQRLEDKAEDQEKSMRRKIDEIDRLENRLKDEAILREDSKRLVKESEQCKKDLETTQQKLNHSLEELKKMKDWEDAFNKEHEKRLSVALEIKKLQETMPKMNLDPDAYRQTPNIPTAPKTEPSLRVPSLGLELGHTSTDQNANSDDDDDGSIAATEVAPKIQQVFKEVIVIVPLPVPEHNSFLCIWHTFVNFLALVNIYGRLAFSHIDRLVRPKAGLPSSPSPTPAVQSPITISSRTSLNSPLGRSESATQSPTAPGRRLSKQSSRSLQSDQTNTSKRSSQVSEINSEDLNFATSDLGAGSRKSSESSSAGPKHQRKPYFSQEVSDKLPRPSDPSHPRKPRKSIFPQAQKRETSPAQHEEPETKYVQEIEHLNQSTWQRIIDPDPRVPLNAWATLANVICYTIILWIFYQTFTFAMERRHWTQANNITRAYFDELYAFRNQHGRGLIAKLFPEPWSSRLEGAAWSFIKLFGVDFQTYPRPG